MGSPRRANPSRLPWYAALASSAFALLAGSAAAHSEACAVPSAEAAWHAPAVVAGEERLDFDALLERLAEARVVMIGETHDRYDHHINQLELVCRLHQRHPDLAIGLEFFQQPFQDALDAYVEGRIDAAEMLVQTEYYDRWQFDYRLYAPILDFAREHRIPLVALNARKEIASKVAREGIAALSEEERAQIPARLERDIPGYRERLQAIYDEHPEIQDMSLENFVEAQLIWDESMAERAARHLDAHPARRLVVLAGDGHVVRSGIPARFTLRSGLEAVNVLQGDPQKVTAGDADYVLVSEVIELARGGTLGVFLDTGGERLAILDFTKDSAARQIGLRAADEIVELDGAPIASLADLKLALIDKRPGDVVAVRVERDCGGEAKGGASFSVTLH